MRYRTIVAIQFALLGVFSVPATAPAQTSPTTAPYPRPYESGVVPKKLVHVRPEYPEPARAAGAAGLIIAVITIAPVKELHVLRSVHWLLDAPAMDAARQWEFRPTYVDGVARPVVMTLTVSFSLKGFRGEELSTFGPRATVDNVRVRSLTRPVYQTEHPYVPMQR